MDVLTDVLGALRLRSTLYCQVDISAPWGLDFAVTRCATFHVVEQTGCWLHVPSSAPRWVAPGDLIVLPQGAPHRLSDVPETAPILTIRLDQEVPDSCQSRSYTHSGAVTQLLCGIFDLAAEREHPLLALLPPLIHIPATDPRCAPGLRSTLALLTQEALSGRTGTDAIVRRLADVLFIQIVRSWLEGTERAERSWLSALRDPQIGAALALIHRDPAAPWSVAALAAHVSLSRSAFAQRFTALVGEPPLRYVTRWRMQRATELIADGELSIAEIARRVGYDSNVAFGKAYKRTTGHAPRQQARARDVL